MSLTHKTNTKNSREIGCFLYNKIYSYKNYSQLFLQGKPLTYRAFFDIIAQNKYYEYIKALYMALKRVHQGAFVII